MPLNKFIPSKLKNCEYTQKTVSLNQRNTSLIYGQRKNFFELKKFC